MSRISRVFLFLAASLGAHAQNQSIAEIAVATPALSSLVRALNATNLTSTFAGAGDFTVLAPTDAAFNALADGVLDALFANTTALAEVLKYHVIGSSRVPSSAVSATTEALMLNGKKILIQVVNGSVMLNNVAKVTQVDIMATNGIVHVIDAVLIPPTATITDIAVGTPELSELVRALTAANLVDTFSSPGDFTVLAPVNAAFSALPNGTLEALLANVTALTDVLQYHVISSRVPASTVKGSSSAEMLNGKSITIATDGDLAQLNGMVNVTRVNILASNGIIHLIDGVLIPPPDSPSTSVAAIANDASSKSPLVALIASALTMGLVA
eukprot:CAMPEP_0170589856 /NCGR_PEP_ID=MMETSP0224-20130122/11562_1 /TAXON_ID=285029 /ORGANISM="Togula jolla, Strain CCCM 725" /LENGTH=326 /DNA_ID=CAMNT_0010913619 /DNA_START=42 /DNA_END=1022 /DNA_ORIENTATION=-